MARDAENRQPHCGAASTALPADLLPSPAPFPYHPLPRSNIREVHRLALAADRAQVVTAKATVVDFCSSTGVAPESLCEVSWTKHLSDVRTALDDLEEYHQVRPAG